MSATASCAVFRFGVFEIDLQNRELRKRGVRLRLEAKPLQILELMLERPGEVITRKQIQQKLWPDTFVTFDYSLNTAVNKLRLALGDSAESPRFIETVARRGYRFIASVGMLTAAATSSSAISARATVSSIAVLPFQNYSGQPELEYLSDGLSEAVIRSVSQTPGVRVMAWSTVLRYKGRELNPQDVARELRVQSVLVGSVVPREDGLRLRAELVDAETGWRLWGEEYQRSREEIQTLSEEIARQIGAKMHPQVTPENRKRWGKRYTENAEAYSDYLKGRYHWYKLSAESLKKSVSHFEQAIEKDPNFALAHSALADAYVLFAFIALLPPCEALQKARAAALRALEIDDGLAEVHASCASVTKLYDWDWPKAEREYRKCLELDPNNAIARRGFGAFLSALGRTEEALAEIYKAQELDPLSLLIGVEVAWNLYMARQYEEAAQQAMRTIEMEPEFTATGHVLGLALEQLGKYDEAIERFQKAGKRSAMQQTTIASLAHAYARCGRTQDSEAILNELTATSSQRYVSPYLFGVMHAGLGEIKKAVDWLEKAFETHDVWMIWVNRDPRFDVLRPESRFQDLLRRMNFPA
ncbi:MAG: winged helix-turn-helix domain-containing protein [Candidatus Acidiferrales bacterium]